MGVALSFAGPLLGAGLAALVHPVLPFLCVTTASRTVKRLHARMMNRRLQADPPKVTCWPGILASDPVRTCQGHQTGPGSVHPNVPGDLPKPSMIIFSGCFEGASSDTRVSVLPLRPARPRRRARLKPGLHPPRASHAARSGVGTAPQRQLSRHREIGFN
ncbi:DUF6356 family protein [Microvirga massiliensis]|uniref:DUF6356 family protein n=1 Tax=Microvirga massiliensis TaxID=1033741 RepID=UPI0031405ED1